jgi:hypothetical protein
MKFGVVLFKNILSLLHWAFERTSEAERFTRGAAFTLELQLPVSYSSQKG